MIPPRERRSRLQRLNCLTNLSHIPLVPGDFFLSDWAEIFRTGRKKTFADRVEIFFFFFYFSLSYWIIYIFSIAIFLVFQCNIFCIYNLNIYFELGTLDIKSVEIFEKYTTITEIWRHLYQKFEKNVVKMHFFKKNENYFFQKIFFSEGPNKLFCYVSKRKLVFFTFFHIVKPLQKSIFVT